MEKTFTVERIGCTPEREYTVTEVTAIAVSIGEDTEDKRQNALLLTNIDEDSGEKFEAVVFGYNMPEDEDEFNDIMADYYAWDTYDKTLETVRIL